MNIKLKSRNHESLDISIDIEIVYISLSNMLNDIYYKKITKINMEVLICQTQMKQITKISKENSK